MSPDDRIAPRAFTKLLAYASHQPWGQEWRATLPIAGVDGTLRNRFSNSPLAGKMWAKTGTLNESTGSRLSDGEQRQDGGVFDPGEWPPPGQRRRVAGHRPDRGGHRGGGVKLYHQSQMRHRSFLNLFRFARLRHSHLQSR